MRRGRSVVISLPTTNQIKANIRQMPRAKKATHIGFITNALIAIGCGLLATKPTIATSEIADLQLFPLSDTVYMLEGGGGNVAICAGDDGVLLVDNKLKSMADQVRAALSHFDNPKLKYILNTHFHGDHTGGNRVFGSEAPIIAHANVRKRLATGAEFGKRFIETAPDTALPVLTFESALTLHFNGEEIKASHFPHAHTDGDIAVFFTTSGIVHLGDLFFNGLFPFVDLEYGGDVESLTRHVGGLIDELPAETKIIPGHGPLATLDDLKNYHRMLVETSAAIRERIAAGKSLDQIRTEGLDSKWKAWNWAFVPTRRWIDILYWSLMSTQP